MGREPTSLPPHRSLAPPSLLTLVEALRETADRLLAGAAFRWTHMGACHCGQLTQTLTALSAAEIHRLALRKAGDWGQQALDHCPTSGYPMDHILESLLALGLTADDLFHLERLDDPRVLAQLPLGERHLDFRSREHAVLYMRTWADLLESQPPVPATTPGH